MISTFAFFSVSLAIAWWLAPRLFRYCDAVLTRQRCKSTLHAQNESIPRLTKVIHLASTQEFLSPRQFNELARLTRAHVPPRDAIQQLTTKDLPEEWGQFTNDLIKQETLETTLQRVTQERHRELSYYLLQASMSDGVFIPAALDEAARVLRERQRTLGEIDIAAAQARLTMKVLTRTPLLLLIALAICNDSFRYVISTRGVIVVLLIALVLNRFGAVWSARLIHRLTSPSEVDEILNVATALSVHLRAGFSLPSACRRLVLFNDLGREIARAVIDEKTFEEVVQPLRDHRHRFGADVAMILTTAYADGQPAVEIIGILTDEARRIRDEQTHIQIRKLTTKLSVPAVLCLLPAFLLVVVVPMFLAQLSTLSGSLQTVTS